MPAKGKEICKPEINSPEEQPRKSKRRHGPTLASCLPGIRTLIAPNAPVDEEPEAESSSEYNLERETNRRFSERGI